MLNQVTVFKALGDENRLKIVEMLTHGELCVCEIIDKLELSQPAVSHNLKILKLSGLINSKKHGKWICYSLNPDTFKNIENYLKQFCNYPGNRQESCCENCDSIAFEEEEINND